MKKTLIIPIIFLSVFYKAQDVGINTSSPTRALDDNGDLRVRTLTDKSSDVNYSNVLVANSNGEIDKWDKANLLSIVQTLAVENKKLTYVSNSPNTGQTVDCGKLRFRFNSNAGVPQPQIQLVTAPAASTTIYYTRIRKVNSPGISTFSGSNSLASNQTAVIPVANTYQNLDGTSYANNTMEELFLTYPGDINLYRVTFLARNSSATQYFYTLICEKF